MVQRLLISLAALFLICYVGFQIYVKISSIYQTETVYMDSIRESARVSGIVLRQEELLCNEASEPIRVNSGITAYTVEDGTKVSTGMTVAEVYQNSRDANTIYKVRALQEKRGRLEKAGEAAPESFGYTSVLNKQIFSEIGRINDQVHSGNVTGLESPSASLLELMNTKQITTGARTDRFEGPINHLEAQIQYYLGQITTQPSPITASKPGYFIRNVDGLEGYLNTSGLDELTPEDVNRLMSMELRSDPTVAGKLMVSHNWYYIVTVPSEDARFRPGRSVTIDFGLDDSVSAVITHVNTIKDQDQSVVVFRSNYINPEVLALRSTQAEVSFNAVSGLRVSTEALRFEELVRGVYVIQGEVMIFRPVNILYEGSGYVLVENVTDEEHYKNSLKLYDEVITEGWRLYNGKPIK